MRGDYRQIFLGVYLALSIPSNPPKKYNFLKIPNILRNKSRIIVRNSYKKKVDLSLFLRTAEQNDDPKCHLVTFLVDTGAPTKSCGLLKLYFHVAPIV